MARAYDANVEHLKSLSFKRWWITARMSECCHFHCIYHPSPNADLPNDNIKLSSLQRSVDFGLNIHFINFAICRFDTILRIARYRCCVSYKALSYHTEETKPRRAVHTARFALAPKHLMHCISESHTYNLQPYPNLRT